MVSQWVKSEVLPSPINHHNRRHPANNLPHWGSRGTAEPAEAINATIVDKYIKVKVEYGSIVRNVVKWRNTAEVAVVVVAEVAVVVVAEVAVVVTMY